MDLTFILIGIAVVVGVVGQYLLKVGMTHVGQIDSVMSLLDPSVLVRMASTWQIPIALVMYAAGAFLWMIVLSREELNFAYPFMALTYVLVLIVGYFFLGETLTVNKVLGTLLVAVGVVVITRG